MKTLDEKSDVLIAVASYNEAANIKDLVSRIRNACGSSIDILVVDDNSPDGTQNVISLLQVNDKNLHLVGREYKLGLGSAHKMIFAFAIANNYEKVVTLDADLSHRPEEIPKLLERSGKGKFVIGSRYVNGGSSNYSGWRNFVSRVGNVVSRLVVGTDLREFTTSFRVFNTATLRKIPLHKIKSNGYAFFVEIIFYLSYLDLEFVEVPISFEDRKNDLSKIPRAQMLYSCWSLVNLFLNRLFGKRFSQKTKWLKVSGCRFCRNKFLLLRHSGIEQFIDSGLEPNKFSCSSVSTQSDAPAVYDCLNCGLTQVSVDTYPRDLADYYIYSEDKEYLYNRDVKVKTFSRAFRKIEHFFPTENNLRVLDIGSYFGIFLGMLGKPRFDCLGIEPSRYAVDYCVNQTGIAVFSGDLEAYLRENSDNKQFNIITAWDVLEHVGEPSKFLLQVNGLLAPTGSFVFSTICIDSLVARILGRRWPWILPMHVTYFNKRILSTMLYECGFEILQVGNHVHYARLSYIVSACTNIAPSLLHGFIRSIAKVFPKSAIIPVALGDVRMYVCRKVL
jgi:dolichol-phosphate mannosyltransferase